MCSKIKVNLQSVFSQILILLFLTHNLLPYFGLRFESCQTMFSNFEISPDGGLNNHFFFRQSSLSDLGTYVSLRDLQIKWQQPPSVKHETQEIFLREASWLNVEALRWILKGMCSQVEFISAEVSQDRLSYRKIKNLCLNEYYNNPRLFIPIQLYPPSDSYELKMTKTWEVRP